MDLPVDRLSGQTADRLARIPDDFRALPEEAPLPMPAQPLHAAGARTIPATSPPRIGPRRVAVIGGAIAITGAAAYQMYRVLATNGLTAPGAVMVLLFVLLFGWIALAFTSAVAGFVSVLRGDGQALAEASDEPPRTRTALLMPTYNESPARVAAAIEAIAESLAFLGARDVFDIFMLSDTTDPDIWIEEEAAFLALRARLPCRLFYRRRSQNTARKAGNIAEWVMRFGGAYPQFLILDADSVMSGEVLLRLVAYVERHPAVGLVQTLPVIVGAVTPFARLQQFAASVYGPVIAQGLAFWHGAEGNYWGHNAMIRTRAFADCAGLPVLSGRKPFGGHILSHDFVEAALLRRGGWAVHLFPGLGGSFEESPPSLIDVAIRDRRWCQGNLQHAAVLPARGLHWVSRLHLLTGIGSYVTAPLWLLFLLVGLVIALQAHFEPFDYFPAGRSLFPRWPVVDPVRARWLFEGAMGVLLAPKLLGLFATLLRGQDRRGCSGALRLLTGVVVETILSGLIAPIAMLTQTLDVISVLRGRDSGWHPQRRENGGTAVAEIARRYGPHTLLGFGFAGTAVLVSPFLALWMLPVAAGLVLAIPLALLTGHRASGRALRRVGLLRTPEEAAPPPVLRRATELHQPTMNGAGPTGLRRLFSDPMLLSAHLSMLPPPRRRREGPIPLALVVGRAKLEEADTLDEALATMTPAETAAVLGDEECVREALSLAKMPCSARLNAES